jgi:hypothetical protein
VNNQWVSASELSIGDRVRRLDGSFGRVEAITKEERPQVMHNLTVADAHTFFVGQQQWLVHNCFRGPAAKGFDWEGIFRKHSDSGQVAQQSGRKTIFEGMTDNQIQVRVKGAWENRELIKTQTDRDGIKRMLYSGIDKVSGERVEMWFNSTTKIVETAYPVLK